MAINQYFDESKIIKKNQTENNTTKETETKVEIKEEPKIENEIVTNVTIEQKIESVDINNNANALNISDDVIANKRNEYIETIQNFTNEEKEKPLYNFTRENGKVKINPVVSSANVKEENIKEQNIKEEKTDKDIYYEQLNKVKDDNERNLQKTKIEIKLYKKLISIELNPDKRKTYEARLDIFVKELDLYKKRKKILEDDNLWLKE